MKLVALLIFTLLTTVGCMPGAEAQRALLAQADRGVSLLGGSIDERQRLHEAEQARLRARLDDAFDADLRQQPTMSVEDVIEARRAYAAGIDALHDAAMRTRDALAALAYLRTRPEATDHIIVCGRGLGGIVALHVAACDERVRGVIVWEGLISFRSLLEAEAYAWPADAFWPGVLLHYDLPELAEALSCPVRILGPRDGAGRPLAEAELARLNRSAKVVYSQGSDAVALAEAVAALLM